MSFTFRFLKPSDPYFPNWVDMRRRTVLAWVGFAAFGPLSLLLDFFCFLAFRLEGLPWVALPGVLLFFGLAIYQGLWPCPRCGNPFYSSGGMLLYWPFANNCLHCKLPEYAPNGDYP